MILENIFSIVSPLQLIFFIIFFLTYVLLKEPISWTKLKSIPGPYKLPLLGNALAVNVPNDQILGVLENWWKEYGSRIFLAFGSIPRVVITNRFDTEKVLSSQVQINKSDDYNFLMPWLGTGLLTSTGEKWIGRRKLLTPTFHFRILETYHDIFNEHASTLVQILENKFGNGKEFDVYPYITRCALDTICDAAMGCKLNAQEHSDSEYIRALYRINELILYRAVRPWFSNDFVWYQLSSLGREEKKCLKILHSFTEKVIRERKVEFAERKLKEKSGNKEEEEEDLTKGKRRLAFLDLLLETQANEIANGGKPLTDYNIREETDTFMFEGHDTTTANINWAIFAISSNPEVQRRVQEELDGIFGDEPNRPITSEDLTQMKYLECCIKETLRLYPSVPMVARKVTPEPLKLDNGLSIPTGSTLMIIPYFLHRDPEVFPLPENFSPDRFFPENSIGRHPYAYVPFSAGPRNCIGQKFAIMEVKIILAYLFRKFNITPMEKKEDITICVDLILRPKDGIHIKINKRN